MTGPVQPVEAATVVLVRAGEPPGSPWQCFMVRRHIRSDFAADVFVFPGGKVDPSDGDPSMTGLCVDHPAPEIGDAAAWRARRLAGVRELFEEAGVLLAVDSSGALVDIGANSALRFAEYRHKIHAGEMSLRELAEAENLRFALDRLHPISRWITPEIMHRRFDTYFFVAYMPEGQDPVHDAGETIDSVWISPAEALRRFHVGDFPLVFATERHLERMAEFPSVEGLIAATTPSDLIPVMPRPVQQDGETRFLIPGDEGYDRA